MSRAFLLFTVGEPLSTPILRRKKELRAWWLRRTAELLLFCCVEELLRFALFFSLLPST